MGNAYYILAKGSSTLHWLFIKRTHLKRSGHKTLLSSFVSTEEHVEGIRSVYDAHPCTTGIASALGYGLCFQPQVSIPSFCRRVYRLSPRVRGPLFLPMLRLVLVSLIGRMKTLKMTSSPLLLPQLVLWHQVHRLLQILSVILMKYIRHLMTILRSPLVLLMSLSCFVLNIVVL
jgi:hypothetical protein